MDEFITLDLSALLAVLFIALSCSLLGNYLLLKKESLLGDSISHSVLPGIVLAYMLSGSRAVFPIFIGALIAGFLSSLFIWLLVRFGRTDPSSAMGVVFSIFFAIGVILIESASLRGVDLDPDCLLYGQVETVFWLPKGGESVSIGNYFQNLPTEVLSSAGVLVVVSIFIAILWKELSLLCFDRGFCQAQGFKPFSLEILLLMLVSISVVSSFKIVGSILVVALLVAPAASARLLTNRFGMQVALSLLIASVSVFIGYFLSTKAPMVFGINGALNVAGGVASVLGAVFILIGLLAPTYGILPRFIKSQLVRLETLKEDILGLLYRSEEEGKLGLPLELFFSKLYSRPLLYMALLGLRKKSLIYSEKKYSLTDFGRIRAKELIRSHRLWEVYLSSKIGLDPDHVHQTAENLEHIQSPILLKELEKESKETDLDPHGKPIP